MLELRFSSRRSGAGLTLTGAQTFVQPVSAVERDDTFGFTLASGDFNANGVTDLGVGAPFESVGGAIAAGVVSAVPGSAGGLVGDGLLFTQTTPGVPSVAESGDFFGWALAVGDPGPATTAASPSSAAVSKIQRVTGAGR